MMSKYKYLISTLLTMMLSLAASAQEKAVWAYHNGETTPYATFDNLHEALGNTSFVAKDIFELHADVTEPDTRDSYSIGGTPYYYAFKIEKTLTIRSVNGQKYTVSGPDSASEIAYFFLCWNYGTKVNLLIENVVFSFEQYPDKPNFIYYGFNTQGDVTLENVDVISGGSMYGQYSKFDFNQCSFKDMDQVVYVSSENTLSMQGCTVDNCCAPSTDVSYLGGAVKLSNTKGVVLKNVKFQNNKLGVYINGNATCTIDGKNTLFTNNEQVLHVVGGVCTINNGTFKNNVNALANDYNDEEKSVFKVGSWSQSATLVINGGTFENNSTTEIQTGNGNRVIGNAVFSVEEQGVLKLHGGYFTNNNTGTGRHGEVVSADRGTSNYSESNYGKITVSGKPVFDDGQYIYLEKWHKTMNGDWYEGIQHIYKDGALSSEAKVNVSMRMGAGFLINHSLDILVADGVNVLRNDLNVFNNPYTDIYRGENAITDYLRFNPHGGDSNKQPVIEFAPINMTTIQITRYDLQEGDNAIFCIYQETSPGEWVKISSIPLTGKAIGKVSRTVTVSGTGNLKIVETDFNYKYEKTETKINGVSCTEQGVGYVNASADLDLITFEVHGEKKYHIGTENSKQNIFHRRRNPR